MGVSLRLWWVSYIVPHAQKTQIYRIYGINAGNYGPEKHGIWWSQWTPCLHFERWYTKNGGPNHDGKWVLILCYGAPISHPLDVSGMYILCLYIYIRYPYQKSCYVDVFIMFDIHWFHFEGALRQRTSLFVLLGSAFLLFQLSLVVGCPWVNQHTDMENPRQSIVLKEHDLF